MKLSLFLLIAFLGSSILATDPPPLRVLCYNIHFGQGTDKTYDLERLAAVIQKYDPDLVALQEVDVVVNRSGRVHQAQKLGELTGLEVRYGPTQHYQGGLYGNAILSKLPILDVEIQPLPYTEATPELRTFPRGAIAVTVEAPDGAPLVFISTHFQHNLEEDRLAQATAVNQLFAKPSDLRSVLAGDMNATPDSDPIAKLHKLWTNAISPQAVPTAPSIDPTRRIDYVFYRPQSAFTVIHTEVIDESLASDHRPVFTILELKP